MKRAALLFLVLFPAAALPQAANVQVNRDNKTISVFAEHTMSVEPEIASVKFGYRSTSPQKDAAFQDNVRVSSAIVAALTQAGIKESDISTESLQLEKQEDNGRNPKGAPLQFEAFQQWTVRVAARDAQRVVDIVVKAGANDVSDPEWLVSDPVALEAKAYGAALSKARKIAEQMAAGLGTQIGDLVYATNSSAASMYRVGSSAQMVMVESARMSSPEPVLKVFPKKVEQRATVTAVFSIK